MSAFDLHALIDDARGLEDIKKILRAIVTLMGDSDTEITHQRNEWHSQTNEFLRHGGDGAPSEAHTARDMSGLTPAQIASLPASLRKLKPK